MPEDKQREDLTRDQNLESGVDKEVKKERLNQEKSEKDDDDEEYFIKKRKRPNKTTLIY
jgi:hypothetical protein